MKKTILILTALMVSFMGETKADPYTCGEGLGTLYAHKTQLEMYATQQNFVAACQLPGVATALNQASQNCCSDDISKGIFAQAAGQAMVNKVCSMAQTVAGFCHSILSELP